MASNRVIPHSDTKGKALPSTASIRRVAQLTQHLAPVTETEQVNTRPTLPIDYPVSRLQLDANKHIDDIRPLKVAVIGVCIPHVTLVGISLLTAEGRSGGYQCWYPTSC
jgi:hypothetical protein